MLLFTLSMARRQKLLRLLFGEAVGGELIELPDSVHVSPRGGLSIELDERYAKRRSAARARVRAFYGLTEDGSDAHESDIQD